MALDPELLKRRQRRPQKRGPERTLGEKIGQLSGADEKLEELLEELVRLAERQTIFTMSLELHQITAALYHGGYSIDAYVNIERQLAPGATVIAYLPVAPGFVYLPIESQIVSSLPWWLTTTVWVDTDFPALPYTFLVRAPEFYKHINRGLFPVFRFFNFTVTNNHLVDTANFCAINLFTIMTRTTWEMIEGVFLKPIVGFLRERAEKETGRPFP